MRLPFLWQHAQRVKKGASPSEVVYEEDQLKLLHYLSDEPRKFKTPLVVVFALVNRPYILDLMPEKSVVGQFVKAGFDVYLIDWGTPTHADRHLTLDSYVNGYMLNVVDHLRERTGSEAVNVLGYCMGGTMSAIFSAAPAAFAIALDGCTAKASWAGAPTATLNALLVTVSAPLVAVRV